MNQTENQRAKLRQRKSKPWAQYERRKESMMNLSMPILYLCKRSSMRAKTMSREIRKAMKLGFCVRARDGGERDETEREKTIAVQGTDTKRMKNHLCLAGV